ncbi:MAG: T9SS type A sorting domain-containing protein, partial [Clostridia bacterium]|nr:T9SS type A sorting domain-containing protein [Clostridia bacterium]
IIMKSPDGNCWRGTVNNQGQMQFIQVDCDNLALSSPGNENEPNRHIRIYPNPTGNQVTVEIAPEYAGVLLSIKSSSGSELETAQLRDVRTIIDLSRYPAGLYFFNITQNASLIEVKKIVKN